jgi:hypothetical protein
LKLSATEAERLLALKEYRNLSDMAFAEIMGYPNAEPVRRMKLAIHDQKPVVIQRPFAFITEKLNGPKSRDTYSLSHGEFFDQVLEDDVRRQLEVTVTTMRPVSEKAVTWLNWWMFWRWI